MDTPTRHPLERAADGALERAESHGGHAAAVWVDAEEGWRVASATHPTQEPYRVWRKRPDAPPSDRGTGRAPGKGWWWFTLDCNCPAIVQSGYAVCWHKAAVRLWQLTYRRRDGREYGDRKAHTSAISRHEPVLNHHAAEPQRGGEWPEREPDVYCDCPDDPCLTDWCPCNWCEEHYAAPMGTRPAAPSNNDLPIVQDLPW